MNQFTRYAFVLIFTLLTGCSQKFLDTGSTLQEAFLGFDDVNMSPQDINALPYASLYARINGEQKIFMVLALAEKNPQTGNTQLKWLSSDKAMITTENGRVVKTLFLPKANLTSLSTTNQLAAPITTSSQWQATYDWQPGYQFGHIAEVTSHLVGSETLASPTWTKSVRHIQENSQFESGRSMTSDYWVDGDGQVVKSIQWIVPEQLFIELEILKPFSAN